MELNKKQLDELLSLEQKRKVAAQLGNDNLIKLFNGKSTYKPIVRKQSPLDQQVAIGINLEEKEQLLKDIKEIKESGHSCSVSTLVRSRALGEVDLQLWKEQAILGLKTLKGETWDKKTIKRQILKYGRLIEKGDASDTEIHFYEKKIADYKRQLELIEAPFQKKGFRLAGRVTLAEANHIRWRAARLHLTVADYMRMLVFNHLPFTEADNNLTIESKIRFYISIIDVANNGWGTPPTVNDNPDVIRYIKELNKAKEEIARLKRELMNR